MTFPAVLVLSSVCYCLLVPWPRPPPPLSPSQAQTWEPQLRPWEIGLRLLQPRPGWQGFVMLSGLILVMIIIFYESLIPLHAQHSNPHRRYFSGASARDITLSNLLPSFRSIKSKCFCRLRFIWEWAGTDQTWLDLGDALMLVEFWLFWLMWPDGLIEMFTPHQPHHAHQPPPAQVQSVERGGREGGGGYIKLSGPLGRK